MRLPTAATLTLAFTLSVCAEPPHVGLMREAVAAARSGDNATTLAKLEEVARLRPDYPRAHINLARMNSALGNSEAALVALQRLAEMGVRINVADPALDSVRESAAFQEISPRLASGPDPVGESGATRLELNHVTGIIESCLHDPKTSTWYFGDVRNRCIWKRTNDGSLTRFTSVDDPLDGIFKVALSPDRKTIWAASSTVGVMTGADNEDGKRATLVAIDASTGRITRKFGTPDDGRKHLIGDFIITSDGSILATDSFSPVIWRLAPDGAALEPWLEHDDFVNLQGVALSADGKSLFVADYSNGIWRIDTTTKAHSLLTPPANATFFGIDALATVGGAILAVQNGVNPQRVLRIEPHSCRVAACGDQARSSQATTLQDHASTARIVACGLPAMTDLALGQVVDGRFHFVANGGWALFDPAPEKEPDPRSVTIVSVAVE